MRQREYRIKINGEMDFIIISPQVLSALIEKIHSSRNVRYLWMWRILCRRSLQIICCG